MNLRIITKNHATDSKIGSPLKIDFKAEWTHESMPTAWELKLSNSSALSDNILQPIVFTMTILQRGHNSDFMRCLIQT